MPTTPTINDGSSNPPRLAVYLNMGTLGDLPEWSAAPKAEGRELLAAIKEAGYQGVQSADPDDCAAVGLANAGGGRVDKPEDAEEVAKRTKDAGQVCATVHAGNGHEDDATIDSLVCATINASVKHDLPIYIETHRATITQDVYRSVQLTQRNPGVRFNGDFSHWYTGLEMVYSGVDKNIAFAGSVLDRVRFMHGRIGNPGCIQVEVGQTFDEATQRDYVQHFMQIWTRVMAGFLKDAQPGDVLPFAPELLFPSINYARAFPDSDGNPREESDRWADALIYCEIAKACFAKAEQEVAQ